MSYINASIALYLAATAQDYTTDKFLQESLKAHNDYRAKHGAPALKLDAKVS